MKMRRSEDARRIVSCRLAVVHSAPHARGGPRAVLGLLFTITGAVGLLLEQALEKLISTVVGASTPAAAVVLAVYFSGIATGGALYARHALRVPRPILAYAILEACVGCWALFIRMFFEPVQALSAAAIQSAGHSTISLLLVRFAVACAWILPPTIAMGASFPAIVGALSRIELAGDGRRAMALFYSLNLIGAIIGTVGGAYWLLPMGGPAAALVCSAALEVGVCAAAIWLQGRAGLVSAGPVEGVKARRVAAPLRADGAFVLVIGGISGYVFFAFEVVAVHLIGATVGTSAYAFADMLAAILIGMLVSGLGVGFIARRRRTLPEVALCGVLLFAALTLALTTSLWDDVARLFLVVRPASFLQAEAYRFLFSSLLLLPCAVGLGGIYPLLFRFASFDDQRKEQLSGLLVAANALGCFSGALTAAFVLIPVLGSQVTLLLLASALALLAGVVALRLFLAPMTRWVLAAAALVTLLCALLQPRWQWQGITSGANVHFAPSYTLPMTDILFVHEDAHGGITTVVKSRGRRVLLTNGKFQGDDRGQMPAQVGFALVPLMHVTHPENALVIGLGTGHSAAVIADAGFTRVDVVELAPGIVEAARNVFGDLNGHILDKSNVTLHVDEGRNFVLRSPRTYDVVTIEISSVWFAGATNLYAREFYAALQEKLAPAGVFQQWIQLHHIGVTEVLAALLTVRDAFEHVELYMVGGQGIILASKQPLGVSQRTIESLRRLESMAPHLAVLESGKVGSLDDLPRWRLYSEADIDALQARFGGHVRNTDMNRFLEYSTPLHQVAPGMKRELVGALLALLPQEQASERRAVLLP